MKLFESKLRLKESALDNLGAFVGKGSFKKVYADKTHKDRVIKTGVGIIDEAKKFQQHQKVSPKVYDFGVEDGVEYSIVEKLDAEKAKTDFENFIDKDRGYVHNWGYKVFSSTKLYNQVRESLTTEKGKNMLDKARDIVLETKSDDVSAGNFAYDKQGNLKIIDL